MCIDCRDQKPSVVTELVLFYFSIVQINQELLNLGGGGGAHSSGTICSGLWKGSKEAKAKVPIPARPSLATSLLWPRWRHVLGRPQDTACCVSTMYFQKTSGLQGKPSGTSCTVESIWETWKDGLVEMRLRRVLGYIRCLRICLTELKRGFWSDPCNGEMFSFISEPHMQESSCINPLVTTAFRDW